MESKKRSLFILFISFIFFLNASAQQGSENVQLKDSTLVNNLIKQAKELNSTDPDKALTLSVQAKDLAEKIEFLSGKAYALKNIGMAQYFKGDYVETMESWHESLSVFEQIKDETGIANMLSNMAAIYNEQGNEEKGLEYSFRSLSISEKLGNKLRILTALSAIGSLYYSKEPTMPKALEYLLRALPLAEEIGDSSAIGTIAGNIGQIYLKKNDYDKAITYFEKSIRQGNPEESSFSYDGIGNVYLQKEDFTKASIYHQKALKIAEESGSKPDMIRSLDGIANIYNKQKDYKTALKYYHQASTIAKEITFTPDLKDIYNEMAQAYYKLSDYKNAFKYLKLYADIKDTLYNIDIDKKLGRLEFDFNLKKKNNEITLLEKDKSLADQKLQKEKLIKEVFMAGLVLAFLIALLIFRNYWQKKQANVLLQQQKAKVETTLSELKAAQSQLIQSEKMASLGELTAGIAHEIQNPLNFVNNLSEVSSDLIDELNQELNKGDVDEAKEIGKDIKQNLEKINHHGKRADAIVKGMLQHSLTSSGQKEPTGINALCDEYVRLAYHGIRAKDKDFNATIKTDFDETTGNINIIPQDIGRVLLNLYNNAFYAINEKKKQVDKDLLGFKNLTGLDSYEPTVSVSTKKNNHKVEISVKDNGNGIPQKIVDKIFQPFFTTKPTGQGTGLGLSLSYDIVKAHGGEIKVESKEGEGATFTIYLPLV